MNPELWEKEKAHDILWITRKKLNKKCSLNDYPYNYTLLLLPFQPFQMKWNYGSFLGERIGKV